MPLNGDGTDRFFLSLQQCMIKASLACPEGIFSDNQLCSLSGGLITLLTKAADQIVERRGISENVVSHHASARVD